MQWLALMPLRGGSRSIPGKNIRPIAGRPLFAWSLEQALVSQCFDACYVATDSAGIAAAVEREFGNAVTVVGRSAETATDTASTESVMLEFQARVPFDVLALIQATSPLTRAEDYRAARAKFIDENLDSLLTGVESKRFFWTRDGKPLNYDPARRPRRQEFDGMLMENGAFYLTRAHVLREHRCRLGGRVGVHAMAAETAIEVDDPKDWDEVERLLGARARDRDPGGRPRLRALVVDVDGTLTDGGMYYGAGGEALKKFDTRDAKGLALVRAQGVRVCVISAEDSPAVAARMRKLGIADYHPGVADKLALLRRLAVDWGLGLEEIGFIGDDLGDLDCLAAVGAAFCPADAVTEVRRQAHYVCLHRGGHGAVREVCDLVAGWPAPDPR
ncbi:MAG: N-acylneuraminate cytidylyltransferase [Gammaproteobacteria bacterium]|nr:N-acylneuraminate cytidylyltransferase [Gammaproteobacteria bacterium]